MTAETSNPTVLSIMGYSHSGSTVLAIALGSHPSVVAVGEVLKLPRSGWTRDENRRCACGRPIHECEFWPVVRDRWFELVGADALPTYIALQRRYEGGRAAWPRLLSARRSRPESFRRYEDLTWAFYRAIADVSGKDVIVDASKPPVRNAALLANRRLNARVVHLVRDGRAVVLSRSRARQRDVERGVPNDQPARSARSIGLGWTVTNLESERVLAMAGPERGIRLTYEAFVSDPVGAMRAIGPLVGLELEEVGRRLLEGAPMDVGHNVGGNALRMTGAISLKPNFDWRTKLTPESERTFWRIGGWLERRYGYER